jgi:hypothetical protein
MFLVLGPRGTTVAGPPGATSVVKSSKQHR